MNKPIGICSWGSVSALGSDPTEVLNEYRDQRSLLNFCSSYDAWGGSIKDTEEKALAEIKDQNKSYRSLDRSVLMALLAAERATVSADWTSGEELGLNLSSSRGATATLEQAIENRQLKKERLSPFTSPNTTLGNLSFWVARHLDLKGFTFSHSITCTSAMHSLFNGIAWLQSGLSQQFIAGGTEAPLTGFTIAQMQALKIYASAQADDYPCRAMEQEKTGNSMILGEGAALFCLEAAPKNPLAWIAGMGYGREAITHAADLSTDGKAMEKAMRMALGESASEEVDVIVTHSPGTIKGDQAERRAIERVFGKKIPLLTNNKWKIGHTLGASAALSLEMALLMLLNNEFFAVPYLVESQKKPHSSISKILINAMGFGGQATSLLITKPLD